MHLRINLISAAYDLFVNVDDVFVKRLEVSQHDNHLNRHIHSHLVGRTQISKISKHMHCTSDSSQQPSRELSLLIIMSMTVVICLILSLNDDDDDDDDVSYRFPLAVKCSCAPKFSPTLPQKYLNLLSYFYQISLDVLPSQEELFASTKYLIFYSQ